MAELKSFLHELDDAVLHGTSEGRLRALWYATDLLIAGRYDEEEIRTFGEVITRLAEEIEVAARVQLARRLATVNHAPISVIHKLAFDASIEVAGPILRESEALDDETLAVNASTTSQAHLLAISERDVIAESVTDVLVRRGNWDVVNTVTKNAGARFSDFGFLHLIKRAEGDAILAENLGLRHDIPRHVFQQLIAKASDDVKQRLSNERPDMVDHVQSTVTDVAGELQSRFGPASMRYAVAKQTVTRHHRLGHLTQDSIGYYAQSHRLEEVTIGLSLLGGLPADVIERVLLDRSREMLLMLAKALGFTWGNTLSLLFLGARNHRINAHDLDGMKNDYQRLNVMTSRSVLKFYQSRRNIGKVLTEAERQLALSVHSV